MAKRKFDVLPGMTERNAQNVLEKGQHLGCFINEIVEAVY